MKNKTLSYHSSYWPLPPMALAQSYATGRILDDSGKPIAKGKLRDRWSISTFLTL